MLKNLKSFLFPLTFILINTSMINCTENNRYYDLGYNLENLTSSIDNIDMNKKSDFDKLNKELTTLAESDESQEIDNIIKSKDLNKENIEKLKLVASGKAEAFENNIKEKIEKFSGNLKKSKLKDKEIKEAKKLFSLFLDHQNRLFKSDYAYYLYTFDSKDWDIFSLVTSLFDNNIENFCIEADIEEETLSNFLLAFSQIQLNIDLDEEETEDFITNLKDIAQKLSSDDFKDNLIEKIDNQNEWSKDKKEIYKEYLSSMIVLIKEANDSIDFEIVLNSNLLKKINLL